MVVGILLFVAGTLLVQYGMMRIKTGMDELERNRINRKKVK